MDQSRSALVSLGVSTVFALAGCAAPKHPATPHWGYEGAIGPAHWGALSPEYARCATGKRQSPIDIGAAEAKDLPDIAFHYETVPVEIVNNGHTVQVNYAPGSWIELDGQRYHLQQFHFHSPSEHRVRGKASRAEMHLVHKASNGDVAVVGVLIEEGAHNAGFDPVWRNIPVSVGSPHRMDASVDADDLLPKDRRSYRYDGSFTTPPGTEGVKWAVIKEPVRMSGAQIAAFRRVMSGNNRPTQPLNGRVVAEDTSE